MKKNDELTGIVTAIGSNMEGIIRIDNNVCFVPYALIGEKVKFKVLKVNKNLAFCKLIEVLTPAEERVRPRCYVYEKCGGCQLQHLKYTEQLKVKTNSVNDCLKKIALLDVKVSNCVKSDFEYEYRNKLQLPIRCVNGENKIGFFAQNSHRIVEISSCPIQAAWATNIISAFKSYLLKSKETCYQEETKSGLIRHLVVREVYGKLIIVVVINGETLATSNLLVEELKNYFKEFSLFTNVNKEDSNVILGDKYSLVYGEISYLVEEFGLNYQIVPQSFIQVNNNVKKKLYTSAVKLLSENQDKVVIDAYSGAGLMTALFSKNAKKVYGIEIIKEAVDSANKLAKDNNLLDKIQNFVGDCAEILPNLVKELRSENENVSVVLDPPRKGCDRKVIESILSSLPDEIVYISCSPQTLARDLGLLMNTLEYQGNELKKVDAPSSKYETTKIQCFDMFPQTKHVETLVSLKRV